MAVAERILNLRPLADTRPDRALVKEAQGGDPGASSVLIERYYPRVYSFVSHLTYSRASAEDLTQEVFTRALKALGRFNGQYQFEHWLLRIAKNLCIDEARRYGRSPEPTDPGELPELEGIPAPDYVWETVSQELVASVVRRALSALPSRQRAVLVLREMEGMSYADIAQVIGTNPRGVEATLRRARVRFRMEIAHAESVEEGQAACRRVLRLVADDPAGSRSEEAAQHLAQCAECRRAARASQGRPARAFGFIPLVGLLKGWSALQHGGSAVGSSLRRATSRVKDASMMAGLGLGGGAVMAAPLARMAEVTGGVLVATVVVVAPMSQAAAPVATSAPTYVPAPAQLQVASVPSVALLYRASAASQQVSSTRTFFQTSSAPITPSVVGPQQIIASSPDLAGTLSTVTDNLVNEAVSGVESITTILTAQLAAVNQLANSTVAEVSSPLTSLAPVLSTVTGTVNGVTAGVDGLLNGVGTGVPGLTSGSTGTSSAGTSSAGTSSGGTSSGGTSANSTQKSSSTKP